MYEFAVVALLGLAAFKVVDLVAEVVPDINKFRTVATFALSLAAVVALDYSVFAGFGITVREAWLGTVVTGLIVGAVSAAWQAIFAYLGSAETVTGQRRTDRPRIAA